MQESENNVFDLIKKNIQYQHDQLKMIDELVKLPEKLNEYIENIDDYFFDAFTRDNNIVILIYKLSDNNIITEDKIVLPYGNKTEYEKSRIKIACSEIQKTYTNIVLFIKKRNQSNL